ncbi:MAG TPA: glycosyltransferase [Vicinamibacterales bacterium]|nr:glycosyltransferase [Vicinamibacterales bacterium]
MTSAPVRTSVIVPTRNRPERLQRCLAALIAQRCDPREYEVIVVDDGSDAPLDDIAGAVSAPVNIMLIRQPHAGPAAARNNGASRATGELLAFTDDDCEPDPQWIAALSARHRQFPQAMIGGRTVNALTLNTCAEASQLLVDYLYEYYAGEDRTAANGPARTAGVRFFTSNNLAVPSALFQAVGGFDPGFRLAAGEDRELCDRWHTHGYPLVFEPDALVRHSHALSVARFWRQHLNYGRGARQVRLARQRRQAQTVGIEPLRFYRELVLYPFRVRPAGQAVGLSALLTLSQVANAIGYLRERTATADIVSASEPRP